MGQQNEDVNEQRKATAGNALNRSRRRRLKIIRLIVEMSILILLLFLLFRLAFQNFHIQGHSMEPSLHDQEYILVNKAAYLLQSPARGDIIVFHYPLNPKQNYIKRIIAIPGDVISIHDETVTIDNVTVHETYVNPTNPYNPFPSFSNRILQPGQYFVMGDNRGSSSDSRQWGMVPRDNIIGKAVIIYWPFNQDNFGLLPDKSNVFAQVHQ